MDIGEFLQVPDDHTAQSLAADFVSKNPKESVCMLMMMRAVSLSFKAKVDDLVSTLEGQIVSLKSKCADLEERNARLEDRVLATEAYSGRATAILTGMPEKDNEVTAGVVTDTIRTILPSFTQGDISVAHRNRQSNTGKPRSITVVFKSIAHKDFVSNFKNIGPLRERGVGVYHYAPPAVRDRKSQIEEQDCVDKCYYDGPNKMFSVKLTSGKFVRHILSVGQLLSAVAKLQSVDS